MLRKNLTKRSQKEPLAGGSMSENLTLFLRFHLFPFLLPFAKLDLVIFTSFGNKTLALAPTLFLLHSVFVFTIWYILIWILRNIFHFIYTLLCFINLLYFMLLLFLIITQYCGTCDYTCVIYSTSMIEINTELLRKRFGSLRSFNSFYIFIILIKHYIYCKYNYF